MQMRNKRFMVVRLFFFALVVSCQLFAQSNKPKSPEEVVRQYCDLDFEGARLSSEGFSKLAGLYSWPGEPGWDRLTVIKRFHVNGAKQIDARHAVVPVEYVQVGTLGDAFTPSEKTENVRFRLIKKGSDWLITSPIIQPHVSPSAAMHHIEGLIRDEGEESRAKWAKALLDLKSLEPTSPQ
jgi:hypothetical protein